MGLFPKKRVSTRTEAQILTEALGKLKQHEEDKSRRRRRTGTWRRYLDPRLLVGLLVILVVLIADGVRRENREFEATVSDLRGSVLVAESELVSGAPAALRQRLADGNVVGTGPNSSATLSFADGSVLVVGPDSLMTVKLLEYNRGGAWRMRSFYLKVGRLWGSVSPRFGPGSQLRVYTPASVAAVRGTVFMVEQTRAGDLSTVACAQGDMAVAGFSGNPVPLPGGSKSQVPRGERAPAPTRLTRQETLVFRQGALWQPPPGASKLQKAEYALTQLLNAPLTILGIGKCGWAFGAVDAARGIAAMEAMRRLQIHLEGTVNYPAYVNPATLEELGLPWRDRWQILQQLDGRALARYQVGQGGRDYLLYARARNIKRTLYRVTSYGVERATPEEESSIL